MNKNSQESLFGKSGYIAVQDYVIDCVGQKQTTWNVPLSFIEQVHFFILRLFLRISWFSSVLYIRHPYEESPFYTGLLKYFKKHGLFDYYLERDVIYPGAYSYYIHKKVLVNGKTNYINAQGVGNTPELALSKALGEMFERMISGVWDQNSEVVTSSVAQLRAKKMVVFYPPDYHTFLPEQLNDFPELKHEADDQVRWVKGKDLIAGECVHIPKQVTSWFEGSRNSKKVFLNATTNGSAAYFTKEGAIVRGLLEVIQRDGFFVHWLTKTAPRVIAINSLPEELQEKVHIYNSIGVTITILDCTALGIPVVCIVAETRTADVPGVSVSAAANLTYFEAIDDALREMIGGVEALRRQPDSLYGDSLSTNRFSLNKITRQNYWRGASALTRIKWFVSGEQVAYPNLESGRLFGCDKEKLDFLKVHLGALGDGYRPVLYEPKHPLTKKVGMYVAQLYIPKAFPLYLMEKYGTFQSQRLEEFWQNSQRTGVFTLNTEPHMFS